MDTAIPGYIALALFIGKELFNLINHIRFRSKCGEKEIKASLDIDKCDISPKNNSSPV